jgi:uncharacterized membrane protein YadS
MTIMMLLTFIVSFTNTVEAAYNWGSKINAVDNVKDTSNAAKKTQNVVGAVLKVTRIIAVGIALIMLTVLAMKYMYSAPGEKATIKQHAVVYIVGAIVLFASAGILAIIENFATTNIKSTT